jgi:hypothetical protein
MTGTNEEDLFELVQETDLYEILERGDYVKINQANVNDPRKARIWEIADKKDGRTYTFILPTGKESSLHPNYLEGQPMMRIVKVLGKDMHVRIEEGTDEGIKKHEIGIEYKYSRDDKIINPLMEKDLYEMKDFFENYKNGPDYTPPPEIFKDSFSFAFA